SHGKRPIGNIFRHDGTSCHASSGANFDRSDENGVASGGSTVGDDGARLLPGDVIVVGRNCSCAYVDVLSQAGVADVTQMRHIGVRVDLALLDLDIVSYAHLVLYDSALTQISKGSDAAFRANLRIHNQRLSDGSPISNCGGSVNNGVRANHASAANLDVAH